MKFSKLILIVLPLFFIGCNNTPIIEELNTITIKPDSSSSIQISDFLQNTQLKYIDNQLLAYWLNYNAKTLNIFNYSTKERIAIALDTLITNSIHQKIDYQMLDKNNLGFYS